MFRIVIILTLICQSVYLFGQQKIHFTLPQNILTKGENLSLLIKKTTLSRHTMPVMITIQSCRDISTIWKQQIDVDDDNYQYIASLPEKIYEGSYIITASVPELNRPNIIESHSIIFHIVHQGISEAYFAFKNTETTWNSTLTAQKIQKRSSPTIKNPTENPVILVDKSYLWKPYTKKMIATGSADTLHRLYFQSEPNNNYVVFFYESRKPYNLQPSFEKNIVACTPSTDALRQFYFIFDVFTNKNIDIPNIDIMPKIALSDLVLMDVTDIDHINSLSENATLTEKINHIMYDAVTNQTNENNHPISNDNEYEMSDFQEFESLTLFIKEVVLPAKIVPSSKQKDQIEIILLSGVNKKWYPNKSLLMIDGKAVENHAIIREMAWKDISSIKIYRKTETLRKYYGSMGRYGVIEINTKKHYNTPTTSKNLILPISKSNVAPTADTRPRLKPIQYIGDIAQLTHGDRTGMFYLIEFGANQLILNTNYEVQ